VREHDEISSHYDPMIAQLVCWDEQRPLAVRRINRALEDYRIVGVTHNINFLANILDSRPFNAGDLSTSFLEENADLLVGTDSISPRRFRALAALYLAESEAARARAEDRRSSDRNSPWSSLAAWRLNGPARSTVRLLDDEGQEIAVGLVREGGGAYLVDVDGQVIRATACLEGHRLLAELDGHSLKATVTGTSSAVTVLFRHHAHTFALPSFARAAEQEEAGGHLDAPINGIVVGIRCRVGDEVQRGETLAVIEAMKMQYSICAPMDGTVTEILYGVGDQVIEGQPLLVMDGRD
jgi:3-methylcrotonyl-CoA carboxylase alpha subunit